MPNRYCINMMTPKQAAECEGEIKKMWNSKREKLKNHYFF